MTETVLTVHFVERPGAVDRIISLLRRRSFPIAGVTVGRTHERGVGRMSVTVSDAPAVQQVRHHLLRIPDVRAVHVEASDAVHREYALVRIRCRRDEQDKIVPGLTRFGARAIRIGREHVVIEAAGSAAQIDELFRSLTGYPIEESARTSPIALGRESRPDISLSERMLSESTGSH